MAKDKAVITAILLILVSFSLTACFKTNKEPIALFTAFPTSGEAPLEVTFDASNSYDPDGSILSFKWNFRDGNTGNGETISHTFNSKGSYNVKLTVTDDKGATDSTSEAITVTESQNQSPTASFTANPTSGVAPLEVDFNASESSDPDGTIVEYSWEFGDGISGSDITISHTYENAGDYTVRLTVRDDDGASDVASTNIAVVSGTEVGGVINSNTTWTKGNSPYVITETIQIPSGITLTIEPGVTIYMPESGDMFLINGKILAHGDPNDKITFEGNDNSNFFSAKNSDVNTFLDLEYCKIKNGQSFWPATGYAQYGAFNLKHCELHDLTDYSYIWYPKQDIHIEYNKFVNSGGFSIGHDNNVKVYIRYNLFDGKNPSLPDYADFCVENWAAYDSSATVVKYNSFTNMAGIVLKLPGGYEDAAMSASQNYWGTQDKSVIESMIYDKNDDITCAGYIQYEPILNEPHPDVPK